MYHFLSIYATDNIHISYNTIHTCMLSLYVPTDEINVTQMTTIPANGRKHEEIVG